MPTYCLIAAVSICNIDTTGGNEDNPGDQNGRRKTVETRHMKNVVEKRKLSRVEVVKDGGSTVVETCEEHTREEQEEHSKVEQL